MDVCIIPGAVSQTVSYTGTAGTVTNPWRGPAVGGPKGVYIYCSTAAYVAIGAAPTATATDFPVPAGVPFTLIVTPTLESFKVSAIQVSSGGSLFAMPVGGA